MTNRFMVSVAAMALIAGTGFANAQGTGMGREAPSGGSAVQHSAPSSDRGAPSSATPMNRSDDAKAPAEKTTQSDEKMAPQGNKSAQDMKSGQKGEKSAQENNTNNNGMKGEKSKSMSSENDNAKGNAKSAADTKAEGRDSKSGMNNADSKTGNTTAQTKSSTDSRSQTTTGNAATSATAAPPPEKRTQIASAFKSEKITETTNVNFDINVGTRVPDSVHFYPLPRRIVDIYPEWRGYDVIFVHGRYIIVRPETHEIVYIIEG